MPLENEGKYTIRYVPPGVKLPFFGGMYATPKDLGGPIYGESDNPTSATGPQTWQLFKVAGQENVWKISSPEWPNTPYTVVRGPGPVLPGWGLPGVVPSGRSDIVTLKVQDVEWRIDASDQEEVYVIAPAKTDGRVGVDYAVDLNNDNETLYIRTFPVIAQPPPRPTWQFIPASN